MRWRKATLRLIPGQPFDRNARAVDRDDIARIAFAAQPPGRRRSGLHKQHRPAGGLVSSDAFARAGDVPVAGNDDIHPALHESGDGHMRTPDDAFAAGEVEGMMRDHDARRVRAGAGEPS